MTYLVLGAVFDELAAMIVTLPFVLPIIVHFGYDPIWWAVLGGDHRVGPRHPADGLVILTNNACTDIPLHKLYKAITPFRSPTLSCWRC